MNPIPFESDPEEIVFPVFIGQQQNMKPTVGEKPARPKFVSAVIFLPTQSFADLSAGN